MAIDGGEDTDIGLLIVMVMLTNIILPMSMRPWEEGGGHACEISRDNGYNTIANALRP